MPQLLSDEDVFGSPITVAKGSSPKLLTDAEVFGGEDTLAQEAKASQSPGQIAKSAAKDIVGYSAGALSQIEDMLVSTANIFSLPGSWATSTLALAKGESPDTAAKAAMNYRESFLPAWLQAPFGKIAEAMGKEEKSYYDENGIGWVMKHFGEGVEKGSQAIGERTGIPPEYLQLVAGQAMDLLGAKGVKTGVKDAAGRYESAAKDRVMAVQRAATPEQEVTVRPGEVGDLAAAEDTKTLREQLDDRLNIKDPATEAKAHSKRLKEIKAAFKDNPAEAKELRALADRRMEQSAWQLVQEAEKTGRTDPEAKLPVDWTEVNDIVQKPGWQRTPEEQIRLRQYARGIGANAPKGSIDPDLLAILGGVGGAALTGKLLYEYFKEKPETEQERRDRLPPNDILTPEELERNQQRQRIQPDGSNAADVAGLIPLAAGAFGAIKGKGGMWHPKAVSTLAAPLHAKLKLVENIMNELQDGEPGPSIKSDWADKAVRNYLNKHAGTETDPLKDVEIPYGDGTIRLEKLTDAAITAQPAKVWQELPGGRVPKVARQEYEQMRPIVERAKPDEPVHELSVLEVPEGGQLGEGLGKGRALNALQSYLSHVGDYLREHVPLDKLGQYDLVRAVKETSKWDAELAKNMEKASLDDTKGAPVYKDYGDGMKWVQLTKPGQFARESDTMGHSVRGYEPSRLKEYIIASELVPTEKLPAFDKALEKMGVKIRGDASSTATAEQLGEAIKQVYPEALLEWNSYTHSDWTPASGDSGHPSYGLGGWDAIKNGTAKIYSLRDARGKSHVTIEVEGEIRPEDSGGNSEPARITQIKGKQNRAPSSEYLPYVQDFVKGGKWGEVGDLGNTGLRDLHTDPRYAHDFPSAYAKLQEKSPGGRFFTNTELQEAEAPPHRSERGSVDPKLLTALALGGAGATAGALMDPDKPWRGAAIGAALPFGLNTLRQGKGLDYAMGNLSTRLGNISPALRLRARDFERRVLDGTDKSLNEVDPFLKVMSKLKGEKAKALDTALMANDTHAISEVLKGDPNLVGGWRKVQNLLRGFEDTQKSLGRFKEGLSGYFPRLVKDLDGLKAALNTEQRTSLEQALIKAEAKMVKEKERGLTDVEKSIIIDRSLNSDAGISHLPGYAHGRRIKEMTEKLRPFYADPREALLRYVSAAVQDAETAKFFGKDLASKTRQGKTITDVETSIGNVVQKEVDAGRMKIDQADDLRSLLRSRFDGGEKSMSGPLQDIRNATNIGLLGSLHSAATQLGDSVMNIYHHGMKPTLGAVVQKLTGKSEVSPKEFGLANHIMEELGSNRFSGKVLQGVFKANGFSVIDQFAKGLNLNAGLIKNRALAATPKGLETLRGRYETAFEDEFPQLVQDLKSGKVTENVKSLLFSELSDAQPISKMEMPQAYLDHPNGRLLYQMKTYMLKQMDIVRRDAYNEIKSGDKKRIAVGLKNLAAVSAALALSNVPGDIVKDFISGRPFDLKKIDMVENLLQNFGINRYSMDQAKKGKPLEVLRDAALPPFKHFQEIGEMGKKAVKYVPLVGRAIYDRALGGNEARKSVELKREKANKRDDLESKYPILRERRLAKQQRIEEKKQAKLRRSM